MENITLERIDFKNGSSGNTPLNKTNMNKIQENTQNALNELTPIITDIENNTDNNINDLIEVKTFIANSMKTLETSGTSIHVTDSADYSCQLKVEGKSEQVQTETSPSPNYPSPIENLSGDLEVKAIARNILPRTFAEDLLKRLNVSSTDNYLVEIDGKNYFKYPAQLGYQTEKNYFIKDVFEENTQYIFKLAIMKESSETDGTYNISIRYTDGSGKAQGNKFINWTNMTEKEAEIISEEGKTIKEIRITYSEGTTYIDLDRYILCKLEAGMDTSKLEYEPYKEQKVTFPLGTQKLMEDGYLGENGVVNKRKQLVLTGTENWYRRNNTNNSFYFSISPNAIKGLCNTYKPFTAPNEIDTKDGIYLLSTSYIIITDLRFTTAEELKAWLAEQYSAGTPVIVEYEMQTEETTPYSAEQQTSYNALQALKTYRTITNISNNQDTNMELTYKMDLQTQLQEIETMLLESGV